LPDRRQEQTIRLFGHGNLRCEGGQAAGVYRCRMKAANDPSMDPVITFAIRYLRPIALAGAAFAIGLIAWALSL
jgi:hypothetical protein